LVLDCWYLVVGQEWRPSANSWVDWVTLGEIGWKPGGRGWGRKRRQSQTFYHKGHEGTQRMWGIPGIDLCKPFGILVGVEGGRGVSYRVICRSGDPVIGKTKPHPSRRMTLILKKLKAKLRGKSQWPKPAARSQQLPAIYLLRSPWSDSRTAPCSARLQTLRGPGRRGQRRARFCWQRPTEQSGFRNSCRL